LPTRRLPNFLKFGQNGKELSEHFYQTSCFGQISRNCQDLPQVVEIGRFAGNELHLITFSFFSKTVGGFIVNFLTGFQKKRKIFWLKSFTFNVRTFGKGQ